jgi:hypothetical protein
MTRAKKIVQACQTQNITATINTVKPGRGNFVVRVQNEPIVELLALKRPFPTLKALDMEQVSQQVIDRVKAL